MATFNEPTPGQRVGVFFSGGLSSLAVAKVMADRGTAVHLVSANVGQRDEPQRERVLLALAAAGATVTDVDLRAEMAETAIDLLRCGAHYDGGYWNSTGALRHVLVSRLAGHLRAAGCDIVTHGCVAGGNDEQRFTKYLAIYAPEVRLLTPWNDLRLAAVFAGRAEMVEYLSQAGPAAASFGDLDAKRTRSTDSCLIGASHEGTDLEDVGSDYTGLRPLYGRMPWDARPERATVTISFRGGRPVAVDRQPMTAHEVIEWANAFGGESGLGLRSVFENRINGTKCRGIYESPGMDLLWFALRSLLEVTLAANEWRVYRGLAEEVGRAVYQGNTCYPSLSAARAGCGVLLQHADGDVQVLAYRGTLHCTRIGELNPTIHILQQRRFANGGHSWQSEGVRAGEGGAEHGASI